MAIYVSIDTLDPDDYRRITRGGDLASVLAQAEIPYGQPSTAEDNSSSEALMAMMAQRGGINVLRPSPETARIAYLMLAAGLDDRTTNDGSSSL